MAHIHGKQEKLVTRGLVYAVDGIDHGTFPGNGSSSTTYGALAGGAAATLQNDTTYRYHKNGILTLDKDNNDYYSVALDLSSTSTVSVGMWARFREYPTSSTRMLMEFSDNMNNSPYEGFQVYAGSSSNSFDLGVAVKGNTGVNQSNFNKSLVNDGRWHYLVFVFDKTQTTNECSLFVDGTQATATTNSATNNNTNSFGDETLYIGGRKPSSGNNAQLPWTLDLGPLHVYKVGLTAAEVTQNFNLWRSRLTSNVTAVTTSNSVIHVDPDNSTSYGGSGTTFTDLSGNSNDGTISGATFVSSVTGSAFDFDGSNDEVQFANWSSLATSEVTYTCWFKTSNTGAYYLLGGRRDNFDSSHLTLAINRDQTTQSTGRITAYIRNSGNSGLNYVVHTSDSGITDGVWHCIHLSCTNGSQKLYLDGELLESGTNSWNHSNAGDFPFTVGAFRTDNYHFNGLIGHVHVRNAVLTAKQVKADYNALAPRYLTGFETGQTDAGANIVTSNLVAHYDMGSPICNPGNGTTITDLGGSNNGTITGPTYSKANGGVLDFDGSNDDFEVTDSTDLRITSAITLQGWINLDAKSGNYQHIAIKQSGASSTAYGLWIKDSGELYAEINASSNSITGATSLATGTWLNVALTYDGSDIKLYLNGSQDASSSPGSITISHGSYPFDLFSGPFNDRIDGKLGSMLLYSSGLSAAQILSNYNATKSRFGL